MYFFWTVMSTEIGNIVCISVICCKIVMNLYNYPKEITFTLHRKMLPMLIDITPPKNLYCIFWNKHVRKRKNRKNKNRSISRCYGSLLCWVKIAKDQLKSLIIISWKKLWYWFYFGWKSQRISYWRLQVFWFKKDRQITGKSMGS